MGPQVNIAPQLGPIHLKLFSSRRRNEIGLGCRNRNSCSFMWDSNWPLNFAEARISRSINLLSCSKKIRLGLPTVEWKTKRQGRRRRRPTCGSRWVQPTFKCYTTKILLSCPQHAAIGISIRYVGLMSTGSSNCYVIRLRKQL